MEKMEIYEKRGKIKENREIIERTGIEGKKEKQ